jgi:hypothetical protein
MRTDAEAAARGGGAEHDREATRRPNTARPRWNGSTNTRTHTAAAPPSPTAPAAPAAPAPAAASPRKWKTPFQRALERVRRNPPTRARVVGRLRVCVSRAVRARVASH